MTLSKTALKLWPLIAWQQNGAYFLLTGVLGENMFRSESTDFEGVTLTFIESRAVINKVSVVVLRSVECEDAMCSPDFVISLDGVWYCGSFVFDLAWWTGVFGGRNIMSWLLTALSAEWEDWARELWLSDMGSVSYFCEFDVSSFALFCWGSALIFHDFFFKLNKIVLPVFVFRCAAWHCKLFVLTWTCWRRFWWWRRRRRRRFQGWQCARRVFGFLVDV